MSERLGKNSLRMLSSSLPLKWSGVMSIGLSVCPPVCFYSL